jgi:hypothetical protein
MERSWKATFSKSIPSSLPIASFANTTVFIEESTMSGTGRYCNAARDIMVAVGGGNRADRESVLCMEELGDVDRGRSLRGKYPSIASAPPWSVMMVSVVACSRYCDRKGPAWEPGGCHCYRNRAIQSAQTSQRTRMQGLDRTIEDSIHLL